MTGSSVADSAAMASPLRVGLTLEQCWHDVPGGTATSALGLAAALDAREDAEVVGISARHRRPPPAAWQPTVPVVSVLLPRPPLYESWHHLRWPHVEDSTGPLDVVHATGMAVPPARGPLVVTVHDLAFLHYPDQPTKRGLRFFNTAIEAARRHADLIHCPSEATADDCLAHGFGADRLRVVPWALDWEIASDAAVATTRARYALQGRYVLFTGTLEPRKNLPALIAAFERLNRPDVDLVLAGPQGWGDEPITESPRVRTLGFVAPRDLPALYRAADVFCYPSMLEGFGLPVLEAMSQSTPVLTSNATATLEVGGDAVLGVDPHDVEAIASGLGSLLDDPARAQALGAAGLGRSRQFNWSDSGAAFMALYRELAR
jgi:glycosyltransferase involved in cell wall biosynthesis